MIGSRAPRSSAASANVFFGICILLAGCSGSSSSPPPPPPQVPSLVSSVQPAAGAQDVARDLEVVALLSEDIDPTSVATDQIVVLSALGVVDGTVSYDGPTRTVRWSPAGGFLPGTAVRATLRAGLRTTAGVVSTMSTSWNFTIEDVIFGPPQTLAISTANGDSVARVALDPDNGNAAVLVGREVWDLRDATPRHEDVGFVVSRSAVSDDGSLCAIRSESTGTPTSPVRELLTAVRDRDGVWRRDRFPLPPGVSVGSLAITGGHGRGFAVTIGQGTPVPSSYYFYGPPAGTASAWSGLGNIGPHGGSRWAPFGAEGVVRATAYQGFQPTLTWFDLNPVGGSTTRSWIQSFQQIAADRSGGLLILSNEITWRLERQLLDGTVTASQEGSAPAGGHAAAGIAPGPGVGAVYWIQSAGTGSSWRLDSTATAATPRTFAISSSTAQATSLEFFYARSGELWLLTRVRETSAPLDSLQLWRQRADEDWRGPTTILAAEPGRALGIPGFALDNSGGVVIAVPRAPAEVVVVRAQ